jgi:hypothetical protein
MTRRLAALRIGTLDGRVTTDFTKPLQPRSEPPTRAQCHHSWEPDMIGGETGKYYYTCARCGATGEQPPTGGWIREVP